MNRARQEGGASISQSGHKALGQPMEARYFRDESLNGEGVIFQGQTPDDRLEIQRSLTVDQQDVDLELDDYCIITGAGATAYGGIRSCVVDEKTVTLELTSAAAESLGLARTLRLHLSQSTIGSISEPLLRMLETSE